MKLSGKLLADDRGIILVISLLILALLIAAGVGAIISMQTDFRTSGNLKAATQAFYNADAGIAHAHQEMQDGDGTNDFNSVFSAPNGAVIVSNSNFNGGTYSVTKKDSASDPNRVKVLSVGTAPNNARAEIESWMRRDAGRPRRAMESNADLVISGNPNIMGACGGAHANEDMRVSGNPGIEMADGLTVSNQTTTNRGIDIAQGMDIIGVPCVGSSECANPPGEQPAANKLDTNEKKSDYVAGHNSEELRNIPRINPADYAQKVADLGAAGSGYICRLDGKVQQGGTCGSNGLCSGGTVVSAPSGWSCSSGNWKVAGASAANGVFYSEGQTEISGSPGSPSSPLQATIIARDSVKISGNPHIKPFPTTSEELENHLLVTGNDLEISGNPTANYANAAILVHQQFNISGNPEISGFVLSNDGLPTWEGDPFPPSASDSGVMLNEILGNAKIIYSCDFGCFGPSCLPPTVTLISWAEKF